VKETLAPGLTVAYEFKIPRNKTVPYLYPEIPAARVMPEVFATGFMVGLIEFACIQAINPHIDWPREQSVGIRIDVKHMAATPPGLTVTVRGTLDRVEGRRLFFSISADDGIDRIAEGTHERFVVDAEKFKGQVAVKAAKAMGGGL
jgi:fluoroacetyl-CoA thioesterase